jgi:hypothetical protein
MQDAPGMHREEAGEGERMTEDLLLSRFWRKVGEGGIDVRLDLLKHYAELTIVRPSDWDTTAVRAEGVGYVQGADCFACLKRSHRTYRHHIIQVQHGGSNDQRNIVDICLNCHKRLHPWIPEGDTTEARNGMVLVGDLLKHVGKRFMRESQVINDPAPEKPRKRVDNDDFPWQK